ncbi:Mov34/MPN/PAD-1 family protein [Thermoproteota archaeon]
MQFLVSLPNTQFKQLMILTIIRQFLCLRYILLNMWQILLSVESINLTKSQYKHLKDISRKAQPFEGCALLLGYVTEKKVKITDIIPTKNIDRSKVTFKIDSTTVFKVYEQADKENKEVIGVFHSHPTPPRPSSLDIQYMSVNPIVWLILSTTNLKISAYQMLDKQIKLIKVINKKN